MGILFYGNNGNIVCKAHDTMYSLSILAGRFESYLVANPEDRLSRDVSHFMCELKSNDNYAIANTIKQIIECVYFCRVRVFRVLARLHHT